MEYKTVPVIKINGPGLYPGLTTSLIFKTDDEVRELLGVLKKQENQIAVFNIKDGSRHRNAIFHEECYPLGVLVNVTKIENHDNGQVTQIYINIVERVELLSDPTSLYGNIHIYPMDNRMDDDIEKELAYKEMLGELFKEYAILYREVEKKKIDYRYKEELLNPIYPLFMQLGQVMDCMSYDPEASYSFLSANSLEDCYFICIELLKKNIEVKKIKKEVSGKVRDNVQEKQRQVLLQEEMNVLRKELNEGSDDLEELEEKAEKLKASDEVKEKVKKEIAKLRRMPAVGAETGLLLNYIEAVLDYPWQVESKENTDIAYAREVLEADHYGLEKIKERILEHLAVRLMLGDGKSQGSIICLAGPPGTGKTSIVKSIARALDRKYVRVSLGGVHDEAEIRGHRKTYIGAMPGRIVAAINKAGVNNPVVLLDELDKLGQDIKGNPADALLEVLDSEQNSAFRDHYMELPIDLSNIIFVATANDKSHIPAALYDRLDIIDVESYTLIEKKHIADKYLIDKQMEKHGLDSSKLLICEDVVESIIDNYTREAGVRELERKIATICRKSTLKLIETGDSSVKITIDNLEDFLGKPYKKEKDKNHKAEVGIVHGLAWTSVGGVVLDVETAVMPGKGELMLTGNMGDVMKESARIALSLVRSRTADLVEEDYYDKHSFHIHIPEGAVPKDGPSAGITLSTALYSAVTGKKVRGDVCMTGEVTLTGRVLAIGGLREKLLAGKIDGYTLGIVPRQNERDVAELSEEILEGMTIKYATCIDDVWQEVLKEETV